MMSNDTLGRSDPGYNRHSLIEAQAILRAFVPNAKVLVTGWCQSVKCTCVMAQSH